MLFKQLAVTRKTGDAIAIKQRTPVAAFAIHRCSVWSPIAARKSFPHLTQPRIAQLIQWSTVNNVVRRVAGIHPTVISGKRQAVGAKNVTLQNRCFQLGINTTEQSTVVITRSPIGSGVKTALLIGAAIVKARQGWVIRVITYLVHHCAVAIGKVNSRTHRNNKPALLTQRKTTYFLRKIKFLMLTCRWLIAMDLFLQNISPIKRLGLRVPRRAFG